MFRVRDRCHVLQLGIYESQYSELEFNFRFLLSHAYIRDLLQNTYMNHNQYSELELCFDFLIQARFIINSIIQQMRNVIAACK